MNYVPIYINNDPINENEWIRADWHRMSTDWWSWFPAKVGKVGNSQSPCLAVKESELQLAVNIHQLLLKQTPFWQRKPRKEPEQRL